MNEKKICFISCVNNHQLYKESLYYINQLEIPEGYEIECICVEGAISMTQGYNKAMKESDAKYKVYLHQDVYIINKSFIKDTLDIFNSNEKIGMLGMAGAKTIPTNGVWWESTHKYGEVYESHTGKMERLQFNEVTNNYEEVKVIDGLIMITQYDISWREDVFDGWHFYDVSQSVEFTSKGYKIVIPKQEDIWCIHDCGILNVKNGYEHYRNVFLDEYSKGVFPLVSILIPAYNQTKYLKEALESAINQTYHNIEIVVGDDSTTNEVENFIGPYLEKYKNITYFKNERDDMDYGYKNVNQLLIRSKGEYINYLNHDDVFLQQKIERMMNCFLENPNVTLVTSVRQTIDENGNKLALNGAFTKLFDKDTLISGREISRCAVINLVNYIGEPTTVLFKKQYIDENKYGYLNNERIKTISDLANWLNILQYGDLVYIADTLSYFRIHSNQNSNKLNVMMTSLIGWFKLVKNSYKIGIVNLKEYKLTLCKCYNLSTSIINKYLCSDENVDNNIKNEVISAYQNAINIMLSEDLDKEYECPICKNKIERFLPYQYKKHKSSFTYKYNIIGSDTENFLCPDCYCHDRERHLVKYFDKLKIWNKNIVNKKILHIAPENHLQKIISNFNSKEYVCGDLYPTNKSITKIDITNIQFEHEYFDFIICNHVLEHIPDDLKAMKELYRVLKKGGYAVLQTPYSPEIDKSFEDEKINTDELRNKFYGQSDHVRIYGKDLFEKIKMAGFKLKIIKNNDLFAYEEYKKYGLNNREDLILVLK